MISILIWQLILLLTDIFKPKGTDPKAQIYAYIIFVDIIRLVLYLNCANHLYQEFNITYVYIPVCHRHWLVSTFH